MLVRELVAQPAPHPVHGAVKHRAVGPGEVDELEHAAAVRLRRQPRQLVQPRALDAEEIPGLELAHGRRPRDVEGARLGGYDPAASEPAKDEGPEAPGIDDGVQRPADGDHERVGALHTLERIEQLVLGLARLGARNQVNQDLAVRRALEDRALGDEVRAQLHGVGQVAVVGEGERPFAVAREHRLGVGQHGRARGRVAGVPDRDVTGQAAQDPFGEEIRDEAHAAVRPGFASGVQRDDAGRLLSPVLQAVQTQIRDAGRVGDTCNADDAAHVAFSLPCDGVSR